MKRIQRQRTKGWRLPEGAVYVGRPTRWGNPFVLGETYMWLTATGLPYPVPTSRAPGDYEFRLRVERLTDHTTAVRWYRAWFEPQADRLGLRHILRGATALACWCPLDQECHASVLIEMLDAP